VNLVEYRCRIKGTSNIVYVKSQNCNMCQIVYVAPDIMKGNHGIIPAGSLEPIDIVKQIYAVENFNAITQDDRLARVDYMQTKRKHVSAAIMKKSEMTDAKRLSIMIRKTPIEYLEELLAKYIVEGNYSVPVKELEET